MYYYYGINTSAGKLLVPDCIPTPVASTCVLHENTDIVLIKLSVSQFGNYLIEECIALMKSFNLPRLSFTFSPFFYNIFIF